MEGIYPVSDVEFRIGTKGLNSTTSDMVIVKDMETFGVSIDNGVEEFIPMDQAGWSRRLVTSKSMTITLNGKRSYGDPGNDYVASMAYALGPEATTKCEVEFPDGSALAMNAVINVTESGGGDSSAISALSFELMSDGKPTYTPGS